MDSLNLLKEKHGERYLSMSENTAVQRLYSYIIEYETVDSDWWNEGHGCNDIVSIFERVFNDGDWNCLVEDISNWSVDQIEFLSLSVVSGHSFYMIDEDTEKHNVKIKATLIKRGHLLIKILNLSNYGDSRLYVWDNVNFLKDLHKSSPELILPIAEKIRYFDYMSMVGNDSNEMKILKGLING